MPRVLQIINRYNLGGPIYNAVYLTKYLSPEFESMLVGGLKDPTEEGSDFIVRQMGIDPVIIPEMRREINPTKDIIAYHKLKRIIQRFKPDIIHTHASKAGLLGRLAASNSKTPAIVHTFHGHVFHSYYKSYKSKIFVNIERSLARRTNKIIAISEKQKDELVNDFRIAGSQKVDIVPNGFDLDKFRVNMEQKRREFRKRYLLDNDEIAIGIIGRLVPVKNHSLFLQAIKYVKEKSRKKIRAFIIGDGECKESIENEIKHLNLDYIHLNHNNNRKALVSFTSWIKNIDTAYPGLDLVALSSLNEGTPVCLIEAQACNIPIVTTNVGGIENIVIPDKTALICNGNGNGAFEFKEKMLRLVSSDELRMQLSKDGWNFVKERFHYKRLVEDMRKLYHNLL